VVASFARGHVHVGYVLRLRQIVEERHWISFPSCSI
jgi:hypothetical protein